MTLRILEMVALDGRRIARVSLNGPYGTVIRRVKIETPYCEKLVNMELLTKGKSYTKIGFENYFSKLKEAVQKYLGEEVKISEKKLDKKMEELLLRYYS